MGVQLRAVVANGAVFAHAPQLPAAPAEPLLLCDLLRHKSGRHVWQDRIGRVGSGCDGGALLLLLLLLQPGSLPPPLGVGLLVGDDRLGLLIAVWRCGFAVTLRPRRRALERCELLLLAQAELVAQLRVTDRCVCHTRRLTSSMCGLLRLLIFIIIMLTCRGTLLGRWRRLEFALSVGQTQLREHRLVLGDVRQSLLLVVAELGWHPIFSPR
eukprot:3612276-Prymnesium_polylepis.1